jgi:hypothetical protein
MKAAGFDAVGSVRVWKTPILAAGTGGARLTHNHERQYHYVLQSLTLWREISHEVGGFPYGFRV